MYQTGAPDRISSPTDLQAERIQDHSRILLDEVPLDHGSNPSSGMLSSILDKSIPVTNFIGGRKPRGSDEHWG